MGQVLSHKVLQALRDAAGDPAAREEFRKELQIPQLLPLLFKIRDEPYSLHDYPQMDAFYQREWAPDSLLMCGRQVAKSTNFSRSEALLAAALRNFQIIYAAPLQSQSYRYSSLYLNEAIRTCRLASALQDPTNTGRYGSAPIKKSVAHQSFLNGSGIQMTYAKTDSDRTRGITADMIDFDEIQDHLYTNVAVLSQSMSNSPWNVRRFAGTAKSTDNTIEFLWRDSSQGEWAIKCTGCNKLNIPSLEHDVLRMVRPHGPSCAKCGKRLNVRSGKWWHAYPDRVNDFIGWHIPQIVVPAITEDPLKWANVLRKIARLPPTTVLNEIFGVSSDIGVRLITSADIQRVSRLGSHETLFKCKDNYKYRVLSIDWGVAEIQSFTVASVLGMTAGGQVHCLYAKRYVGLNPEAVVNDCARLYGHYDCHYCAPDFGMGFLNNAMLANRGLRVVQVQYVRQNKFMSAKQANNITTWTVDRNTALSLIFWKIKNGQIQFADPPYSDTYTRDLLSPYETMVEQSSGLRTKKFLRDPSKPDDFCHALVFGSMVLYHLAGDNILDGDSITNTGYTAEDLYMESEDIDVEMLVQMQQNM